MYNVLDIAKYIILYEYENGHVVSNLKLQKILYFVQAEFLVSKGEACFKEDIVALSFGPVILEVYDKYKVYGGAGIPGLFLKKDFYILDEDKELINNVLEELRSYSASYLTKITLNQEPWCKSYRYNRDRVISKKLIKKYFMED